MSGTALLCALSMVCWSPHVSALDPTLDIAQYHHTAWRIREGFINSEVVTVAQTADGYLWLGTEVGLLRFDGARTVSWRSLAGETLPDSYIRVLLGSRDGTLWIGTLRGGLVSWRSGKLTVYPQLAGQVINSLLEDRRGIIWVGASRPLGGGARLCAIQHGEVQCEQDGRFTLGVTSLYENEQGLWFRDAKSLWRRQSGTSEPQAVGAPLADSPHGIADGGDGTVLVATRAGIRRLGNGASESSLPMPSGLLSRILLRDHDGGVWIGTGGGLLHLHHGRMDAFNRADGLSGNEVQGIFEDREGSIWVQTLEGLDRFSDSTVTTFSVPEGLSNTTVMSVLGARDGSIWITTKDGLNHWRNETLTIYRERSKRAAAEKSQASSEHSSEREVVVPGLAYLGSLFEDGRGRIWVGSEQGAIGYLEYDRYVRVGSSGPYVDGFAEDSSGDLWITDRSFGLLRVRQGRVIERTSWSSLGIQGRASRIVAAPNSQGVWLGFFGGGAARIEDGAIRESYVPSNGLAAGRVLYVGVDAHAALWVGAERGLSRIKGGRIATLDARRGLPCDFVDWMAEDNDQAVWIYTACGILRVTHAEIGSWEAAVDRGEGAAATIHGVVFDESAGVDSHPYLSTYAPHVGKSADGRIWFATLGGVGVVDPHNLRYNKVPPPVHVEQLLADRESHIALPALRLPPLVRDIRIDYTALSLVAPERVLFRYKLEGHDTEWQNVGNRRQAFYTELPPGRYAFRVMAANNSGVWNEQGGTLDFDIAPAYWQTYWFRALCVLAFAALLWAAFQLRLRQVTRMFNMQLEARVGERTRIARDLHDTLLQSVQGLLLRLQTVATLLPGHPTEAKEVIVAAVDQTAQAITEGRNAVQGLRASAEEGADLAAELRSLAELAASEFHNNTVDLNVEVEGTPRTLRPIVRDEVYRITGEVLRNAFRHAQATRIEVELRYSPRELRLRIRDDGRGIEPEFLRKPTEKGERRFGLRGMRERAKLIGGKLAIWTAPGSGTEVELTVPAGRVYTRSALRRPWSFSRLFRRHPWEPS